MAQDDGRPPRLGADTLRSRADNSAQIFEARQRARQQIADEFETQGPDDVPIRRRGGAFGASDAFFDRALPEEAAFQLDDQFPRQDLGPDDVRPADDGGFRPRERVERQAAAFELDEQFGDVDIGPGDVKRQDDGFGLRTDAQRELAAVDLDEQFGDVDIGPGDVKRQDDGFGLRPDAQREVTADEFEDEFDIFGSGDLDPQEDLRERSGGGYGLANDALKEVGAARLDERLPGRDIGPGDVEIDGGEVVFEGRR